MKHGTLPEAFQLLIKAYVDKMREVDSSIKIFVDAIDASHVTAIKSLIGTNNIYLVQHNYLPWNIKNSNLEKNGSAYTVAQLSKENVWYAWVGIPNSFNSAGESIIGGAAIDEGRIQGYKVAVTEVIAKVSCKDKL